VNARFHKIYGVLPSERADVFGQTSKSDRRASMLIRSDVPLMIDNALHEP
jgi:hypothetical protein